MASLDRRDDMDLLEMCEELELRFPEHVARFERRHQDAWTAVTEDGDCDQDLLDELRDDLDALLRI